MAEKGQNHIFSCWTNSTDQDQIGPLVLESSKRRNMIRVYPVCHTICIFFAPSLYASDFFKKSMGYDRIVLVSFLALLHV